MLSPDAAQRAAIRFFERKTADGYNMSSWTILRSHPTKVCPADLVLLAEHTDEEIGTLISHGIGIDNKLYEFQPHVIVDSRGIRPRRAREDAA